MAVIISWKFNIIVKYLRYSVEELKLTNHKLKKILSIINSQSFWQRWLPPKQAPCSYNGKFQVGGYYHREEGESESITGDREEDF